VSSPARRRAKYADFIGVRSPVTQKLAGRPAFCRQWYLRVMAGK
jgi:hypothetical protein